MGGMLKFRGTRKQGLNSQQLYLVQNFPKLVMHKTEVAFTLIFLKRVYKDVFVGYVCVYFKQC